MGLHVYVSSTSIDLKVYREAVLDAIRRLGHIPHAMEYYGAEFVNYVTGRLD